MIGITQKNQKWRIILKDEAWEFEDKETFNNILKDLLKMKETFGNLNDRWSN